MYGAVTAEVVEEAHALGARADLHPMIPWYASITVWPDGRVVPGPHSTSVLPAGVYSCLVLRDNPDTAEMQARKMNAHVDWLRHRDGDLSVYAGRSIEVVLAARGRRLVQDRAQSWLVRDQPQRRVPPGSG